MAVYTSPYSTHYSSPWYNEINDLCDRFGTELSNRKWNMTQEIDGWRNGLLVQINKHVEEQKRLLEQDYTRQRTDIDNFRRQYIDAARQHDYKNDNEQIRQIIVQCKGLKFELGALEFPNQPIPFAQFLTEGQLEQKKREESNARRAGDNTTQNNANRDFPNLSGNNTDQYANAYKQQTSTDFIRMK